VNEHNSWIPRDNWLTDAEKKAILDFHELHPTDGYRRLTWMMNDAEVVAASPTSVWRVLKAAGRLDTWNRHQHWHIDIAYVNVAGTFYYLVSIVDGCSRFIVGWDVRESMTEQDVELVIEMAREAFPGVAPRIISDNGPQFIAGDFKQYIRLTGMTHVRTSRNYPQSNGKSERWHKTIKSEAIRVRPPSSLDEARHLVAGFVEHYNTRRLHSAIDYVTPADRLAGRQEAIKAARLARLEAAREKRAMARQASRREHPPVRPSSPNPLDRHP